MPRVSRQLEVALPIGQVWDFISRPGNLAKWWPRIVRVEGLVGQPGTTGLKWTSLLEADSGRRVRLDFEAVKAEPPTLFSWQQELADTQFEKHLRRQEYLVELEDRGNSTGVELIAETELKGSARLAGLTLRKSQGQLLDRALSDLDHVLSLNAAGREAGDPDQGSSAP